MPVAQILALILNNHVLNDDASHVKKIDFRSSQMMLLTFLLRLPFTEDCNQQKIVTIDSSLFLSLSPQAFLIFNQRRLYSKEHNHDEF